MLENEADYIDIRTERIKELDSLPFTGENLKKVGIVWDCDDDGEPVYAGYQNECHCDICRVVK